MAKLVTGIIRDKSGKLVGTYQTASGVEDIPDDISMRFGGVTQQRLDELKGDPNFHGVGPDTSKYTLERIVGVDPSSYYEYEITGGQYARDLKAYQEKLESVRQETAQRRADEVRRIEAAQKRQEEIAKDVNVKNRFLAHTTGNPFVAPGAREISRRKAKSAIDSFNSNQFELGDAIDSYNSLTFSSAFDTYNKKKALREHNADHGLNTYGGYDNKYNDYSTAKLFSVSEQPVKTEAQINQEKYNEIRPAYQDSRSGLQITGLETIPNKLTRAESQQVNKSLISAQLPHVIENKILAQIPVEKRNAKREQINKFLSSPVENSIIPSAYAETQTTQRVSFGSGGIDKIKEAVAQAKVIGPVTLSYVDADRKEQRVTVKNANEAVRKIYQETKNGSKEFSISATSQPVQGPTIAAPNNEEGFGIAGSLTSVFGKEPQQQGPNLNDKAFFVGANAQGYVIETNRPIEPRPTATDFLGNNAFARGIDDYFQLNKPIKERDDVDRKAFYTNREIGEFTAPFVNRVIEAGDTFKATGESIKGEKAFSWQPGFLGVPSYQPIAKTPKIETTLDKLAQGKTVDFKDKNVRYSAYGNILEIASELYLFGKGAQAGGKGLDKLETIANQKQVNKIITGFEAPKTLVKTKVQGVEPTVSEAGKQEIAASKLYGEVDLLQANKITVKPVKGRTNLFELESTNPSADKIVLAEVFGKDVRFGVLERNPVSVPQRVRIRTPPQDNLSIESAKFGLKKNEPGIFEGQSNKELINAFGTDSVKDVARLRTFTSAQVKAKPKEFSRYFFSEATDSGITPSKPLADILLGETRAFGTVGTKITGRAGSKPTIPPRTKTKKTIIEDPFGKPKTIKIKKTITNQKRIDELEKLEKSKRVLDEQKERMLKPLLDEMEGLVKLKQRGVKNTNSGSVNTRIELLDEEIQRTRDIFKPAYDNYKSEIIRIKNTNPDKIIEETILQPKVKLNQKIKEKKYGDIQTPEIFKPFNESDVVIQPKWYNIFGREKFTKRSASDTFVTDVQRNIKEIDPFGVIGKQKGVKAQSYSTGKFSIDDKPIPPGKNILETKFDRTEILKEIRAQPVKKTEQDILFSAPRGLTAQYHGEITDSVLAFPQGTPEKFKNQVRIDTGLELNYKLKTGQSGEGEYFNRFGLEMFKPTKKEFEKQETIPINIQTRKPDQKIRVTPIQGVGLTPIQTPRTEITTIQTPGLKTDLITDLTTTTITTDIPIKVPPRTGTPFEFGGFGFAFHGFGGGYDRQPRKKKYKKKYIVSSIDPLTPGSIETAGVQQQRVSYNKKIYGSLDISLGKARKKNQPKGKRSKHSIPDPF